VTRCRLLNLLTLLSLLLCVAVAVAWVVSSHSPDLLRWDSQPVGGDDRWASIRNGRLLVGTIPAWPNFRDPSWGKTYEIRQFGVGYGGGWFSRLHDSGISAGVYYRWWEVRLSLVTSMFAIPPAVWIGVHSHRRLKTGRRSRVCESCGYDLRATPDRCPEWGTPKAVPA
jgi:hypothetical protein